MKGRDRCGASERKLRRDGASKLFQLPLDTEARAGRTAAGHQGPEAVGVGHLGGSSTTLRDSDDERPPITTGRALFVTQAEARAQLKLLWKNDGEGCDALLGSIVCTSQKNDDKAADKFFLDVLGVPPPRFRPAQTVGGVLAEHPQNVVLGKALLLSKQDPAPEGRRF